MKVSVMSPEAAIAATSRPARRQPAQSNLPAEHRAWGEERSKHHQYVPLSGPTGHSLPGSEHQLHWDQSYSSRHPSRHYGSPQPHHEKYRRREYHAAGHCVTPHRLRHAYRERLEEADSQPLSEEIQEPDVSEEVQKNPEPENRGRAKRIQWQDEIGEDFDPADDGDDDMAHLLENIECDPPTNRRRDEFRDEEQGCGGELRKNLVTVLASCCAIVALIVLFTLVPIGIYAVIEKGNGDAGGFFRQQGLLEEAVKRVLAAALAPNSTEEGMWVEHVVVSHGSDAYIDVPATYQSRLNSILAPLLSVHEEEIWGGGAGRSPSCIPPETRHVAFSLQRSGRLPATVTFQKCRPEHECQDQKLVHDIRGFSVAFSEKSNQHMFHIRPAETHIGPSENDTSSSRYLTSWIETAGPFEVELSDTGKLALLRFCGYSAVDVDRDPMKPENTRLITVLELKRLYSIWAQRTVPRGDLRDPLSLFKSVISPRNHALHASTTAAILRMLEKKLGPLTSETADGPQPQGMRTLEHRHSWEGGRLKSKILKYAYQKARLSRTRADAVIGTFLNTEDIPDVQKVEAFQPSLETVQPIPEKAVAIPNAVSAMNAFTAREEFGGDAIDKGIQKYPRSDEVEGSVRPADAEIARNTAPKVLLAQASAQQSAHFEHRHAFKHPQTGRLEAEQQRTYSGFTENVHFNPIQAQVHGGKT
jgi:hypothetical protein